MNFDRKNLYFNILCTSVFLAGISSYLLRNSLYVFLFSFVMWLMVSYYSIFIKNIKPSLLCYQITSFVFLYGGSILSYIIKKEPLYNFNEDILLHTYILLLISQFTVYLSYAIFNFQRKNNAPNKNINSLNLIRLISIIFFTIGLIPMILLIRENVEFVSQNSYESLYLRGGSSFNSILVRLSQFFIMSFYLYLSTFPKKKNVLIISTVFLLVRSVSLLSGRRTDFMLSVMIVFFYILIRNIIDDNQKWITKKFVITAVLSFPLLILLLYNISNFRNGEPLSFDLSESFLSFFKDQGVSITVIQYGKYFQDVLPDQPYLFGPIIDFLKYNEITKMFFDFTYYKPQTIESAFWGNSFGDSISYLVLPYTYKLGRGLGSNYIAEAYHTLGLFGVYFINIIYGLVLRYNDMNFGRNIVLSYFSFFMLSRIFYAPRSTALSFISSTFSFTNVIYILFIYLFVKYLGQILSKNNYRSIILKGNSYERKN
ncbi:O-antigen polysaccharide polymerase Wzy family protein [Facklamia sp. P12950]|uniref:O-antigen polysaccharide polymerase Wzy family protein n=1 Tax=unclassified Facklamia TaxID=2622293 RepID=UPI003D16C84A